MSKEKEDDLPTSVRLSAVDVEQFETLKEKLPSFSRRQLRRAALRLGATLLELEPAGLAMAERTPKERRFWLSSRMARKIEGD